MKIEILAYGKAGRGPEAELVERYLGRLPWGARCRELAPGAAIPSAAPGGKTVVLDEHGRQLSSTELAALLGGWRDDGAGEVRFLIGPADGLGGAGAGTGAAVADMAAGTGADLVLAFGRQTWPHLLARAMLAEQLYRAWSILARHPYHRAG